MVLSNELNPFACLKKILNSERYSMVEKCLYGYFSNTPDYECCHSN